MVGIRIHPDNNGAKDDDGTSQGLDVHEQMYVVHLDCVAILAFVDPSMIKVIP